MGTQESQQSQATKIPMSHTLWSPSDTVKDVAESIGLSSLGDEVAKNLAMDVEYRIHEILEQAIKFMRHSKRRTLTTQDISKSMKVLNLEPLYGYDAARPLVFKEAPVGAGSNLYYIDDEEIEFEKLINQPLPKIPRFATYTLHWLSVEGVQPSIPQNPLLSDIKQIPPFLRGSMTNMLTLDSDNSTDALLQLQQNVLGVSAQQQLQSAKKDLDIKPLIKHVLSKELQLYFDKVVDALVKPNPEDDAEIEHLKSAALNSIKSDPGLHQLVPYFIQFIAETITNNLKNLELLSTMLEVIYSLLTNQTLFLEPYIHALMPCILTLLLARKIGNGGAGDQQHFATRDFASSLLAHIIQKYGNSYSTLKPRITRTLLRAFLDTSKSIGTQYGAIIGFKSLGGEVVRIVLLGNVKSWSKMYLEKRSWPEEEAKDKNVLIEAIINCLRVLKVEPTVEDEMEVELSDDLKQKTIERLDGEIASQLFEQQDSKQIVDGIFFGEV